MSKTLKDRDLTVRRPDQDKLPKLNKRLKRSDFSTKLTHSSEDYDELDDLPSFEKM